MADATPPPMPPADIVCISMIRGKTSDTPASASVPSPPDEVRLEDVDGRLHGEDHHVGGGQAQQGGGDRSFEKVPGAGAVDAGPASTRSGVARRYVHDY